MHDPVLRQVFCECKEKNKFAFEVCEIFGDELSVEEMQYWSAYNIITNAAVYDVDIQNMSFEAAIEEIESAVAKRRRKSTKWEQQKGSTQKRVS
jgi:broad-specificity NMP kinase